MSELPAKDMDKPFTPTIRRVLFARGLVPAMVLGCCSWSTAQSNLLVNGSFEAPTVSAYTTINAPNSFSGWTVAAGGVDVVATSLYNPATGLQSLDLNSTRSGSIYQNISTVAGRTYSLAFSFAANPLPDDPAFPSPAVKRIELRWGNTLLGTFAQDSTGRSARDVGSHDYSFAVTGSGFDRLTFTSLTSGSAGPALDNVRLSVVPEPGPAGLIAAGMISTALLRRPKSKMSE